VRDDVSLVNDQSRVRRIRQQGRVPSGLRKRLTG
jgi:hypothetical protein